MNTQGDNNKDDDQWDISQWDLDDADSPDDFDEFTPEEEDTEEVHLEVLSGIEEEKYRTRSIWFTRLIRLAALLSLLVFITVFVVPSIVQGVGLFLSKPKEGDYAELLASAGPPLRFERSEIRYSIVYPPNANQALINHVDPALERAFDSWSNPMRDRINFVPATSDSNDDLLVTFVTELDSAGLATIRPGTEYRPQIFVRVNVPGQFPSSMMIETIACHELGHALGLWGHSSWRGDAMFPIATRRTPSQRDIETMKIVYRTDGE